MLPFPLLMKLRFQLSLEFNKTCLVVRGGKAENISLNEIPVPNQNTIKKSLLNTPKQIQISTGKTPETKYATNNNCK